MYFRLPYKFRRNSVMTEGLKVQISLSLRLSNIKWQGRRIAKLRAIYISKFIGLLGPLNVNSGFVWFCVFLCVYLYVRIDSW